METRKNMHDELYQQKLEMWVNIEVENKKRENYWIKMALYFQLYITNKRDSVMVRVCKGTWGLTWTVSCKETVITFFMQSLIMLEVKKFVSPFLSTATFLMSSCGWFKK